MAGWECQLSNGRSGEPVMVAPFEYHYTAESRQFLIRKDQLDADKTLELEKAGNYLRKTGRVEQQPGRWMKKRHPKRPIPLVP